MLNILLIEDNPGDIRLTTEALKENNIRHHLSVANDGIEAIDFLFKQGLHSGAATPDLILLDLNLPKKDGREILLEIKKHPELKKIPVVVLSTSESELDICESYRNHANCYIPKPMDFGRYNQVIRELHSFWSLTVKLPTRLG